MNEFHKQYKIGKRLNIGIKGYRHVSDVLHESYEVMKKRREGHVYGLRSPFTILNRVLGGSFEIGTNTVIGARPGVGKSAFINILLFKFFELNNVPMIINYWNWEMTDEAQGIRHFSNLTELEVSKLKSAGYDKEDHDETAKYLIDLETLEVIKTNLTSYEDYNFYFWQTPATASFVEEVNLKMREMYPKYYIANAWDHTRLSVGNTSTEERKIFQFMTMTNKVKKAPVYSLNIILSQLNREVERYILDKHYRAPQASDLFGADAVQQYADNIILLHRPENYNVDEWSLGKFYDKNNNLKELKVNSSKRIFAEVVKNREGITGTLAFDHNLALNQITQFTPKING